MLSRWRRWENKKNREEQRSCRPPPLTVDGISIIRSSRLFTDLAPSLADLDDVSHWNGSVRPPLYRRVQKWALTFYEKPEGLSEEKKREGVSRRLKRVS